MLETNKFDRDELAKIAVTPWNLHVPRETEVVFKEKKEVADDNLQDKVSLPGQVCIKPADLEQLGLTRGCPRCDHQISHGPTKRRSHIRRSAG